MGNEQYSRAREQEIHELRLDLKRRIAAAAWGSTHHQTLLVQLEALNLDSDDAQDRWFNDLIREHPLQDR